MKSKHTNLERRKLLRLKKFVAPSLLHPRAEIPSPSLHGVFLSTDLGLSGNLSASPNQGRTLTSCSSDTCPKLHLERLVPSLDGIVAKRKQRLCFCSDCSCREDAGPEMDGEVEIAGHVDGTDAEMQEDLVVVADVHIADVTPMTQIPRHILAPSEDGIAVDCGDDAEIQGHILLKDQIFGDRDGLAGVPDGDRSGVQIHRYIPVPSSGEIVAGEVEANPVQIRGQILDHHGDAADLVLKVSTHEVAPDRHDAAKIRGRTIFAASLEDEIVGDDAEGAQIAPPPADVNFQRGHSHGYIIVREVSEGEGDANLRGHIPSPLADGDDHADDAQILQDDLLPGLDEMTALRCLAYVPLFDLCSLAQVTKRHYKLVKSGELLDLRWMYGNIDRWICIYTSGDCVWTAYNLKSNEWRNLPPAQVDPIFALSDRESLSAGTHLLWLGRECFNFACYKYDLVTNSWEPGPPMVNPRCLFASASDGKFAFVAGGFKAGELQPSILRSAERYDSRAGKWEPLPPMETARQKCSGVFMDGKFYVIGGKDKDHNPLASGEVYDPVTNTWTTIPDMYVPQREPVPSFEPSPPLVAVANNQLYLIDSSTNLLKGYDKGTNTWKVLGPVPVRTDFYNGWGLAFKSHGEELIVIGSFQDSPSAREGVAVFSLRPQFNPAAPEWNSDAQPPPWKLVNLRVRGTGSFLYNCAVMSC